MVQHAFLTEWKKCEARYSHPLKAVVALSGGVDSMVLLHLIQKVVPNSQIVVAHFDHQVRPGSREVASWVKNACLKQGIKAIFLGKRKGPKMSEENLRKERYLFLEKVRQETGADVIVLAHHAQDQLETLLMRLIRGSGVDGLGAMKQKTGVLFRPLLGVSKTELKRWAREHKIPFQEDETNQAITYFRNQIRHELIPQLIKLSQRYGGEEKLLERIGRLTSEIHAVRSENKKRSIRWVKSHVTETPFWRTFTRKKWQGLRISEKKTVALILWKEMVNEPLETKEINLLEKAIQKQKKTVLSGGVQVIASCGQVFLLTPENQIRVSKLRNNPFPWDLVCSKSDSQKLKTLLKKNQGELRFLQPGDRYQSKKMKRRCLKESIPAPERALLPVVAKKGSNELLWYFPLRHAFLQYVKAPWNKN